jgi:hypothetical protein
MKYYFILLVIVILFLLFFYYNNLENFKNYTRNKVNNLFLKNDKNIYKINILKNEEDFNECFKKCNYSDCLKLKLMKQNYKKCMQCQSNNKKCFNNLLSNGVCDNCGSNLKKFNCNDINNYACPNLHDVFNEKGVDPYYLEIINKNNITSPYNQSCLFCWNLKNYF